MTDDAQILGRKVRTLLLQLPDLGQEALLVCLSSILFGDLLRMVQAADHSLFSPGIREHLNAVNAAWCRNEDISVLPPFVPAEGCSREEFALAASVSVLRRFRAVTSIPDDLDAIDKPIVALLCSCDLLSAVSFAEKAGVDGVALLAALTEEADNFSNLVDQPVA